MSDTDPTIEEMERRTVRFASGLGDFRSQHEDRAGIPARVWDWFAPNRVYPLLAPATYEGRSAGAALKGLPGLVVDLTVCPPGEGPVLHRHPKTTENFLCLEGTFEIVWGESGEKQLTLNRFDFCSVPPGAYRTFRNCGTTPAWLLVLIQIPTVEQRDDVDLGAALARQIAQQFGPDIVDRLKSVGFEFAEGR